jgi:hypothetical protein
MASASADASRPMPPFRKLILNFVFIGQTL